MDGHDVPSGTRRLLIRKDGRQEEVQFEVCWPILDAGTYRQVGQKELPMPEIYDIIILPKR